MWYLITAVSFIILTSIWYLERKSHYWKRRNIPYERPQIIVGNLGDVILGRKTLASAYDAIYNNHVGFKYCGIMNFGSPAILLRDPQLIKSLISKKYEKYHNCYNDNNTLAKDRRWKRAKAKLTPQLTPLKVKNMFHLLQDITDKLIRYLKNEPEASRCGLDAKELSVKYASNVISSCVFGIETDCFNSNKPQFHQLGLEIFSYNSFFIILNVIALLFPGLYEIKPPKILSEKLTKNFKELIMSTIRTREEQKIKKHDFLGAMVELKILTRDFDFRLEDTVFRSLGFFLDGFEISVVAFQHVLYELAENIRVQEKLFQQFQIMLLRNEKLAYDSLQEVKYLDMIIYETLRKYPPVPFLAGEYDNLILPPANVDSPELQVPNGTKILIPILSLHYDSCYFEDPHKFVPERFNEELNYRKGKDAFIGFADSAHFCLGHRFALTQLKIAIFSIVINFEIELVEGVHKNGFLETMRFIYEPKTDCTLKFVNRAKNK